MSSEPSKTTGLSFSFGLSLSLGLLGAFVRVFGTLGVHDVDIEFRQAHIDVVQLFSHTCHFFGQIFVELLIHDEAAFFTRLDQLAQLRVFLFNLHARFFHHW